MNSVRQALLELVNLQKQRISQLEVQNRHQATELCKWQDTSEYYSLLHAEISEAILIYGETRCQVSQNRGTEEVTLRRVSPKTRFVERAKRSDEQANGVSE